MSQPIDSDDARRFLSVLDSEAEAFTFQTFADGSEGVPGWRHGSLSNVARWLERQNSEGCGVFAMINAGDGKGRRKANVQRVRALFADFDDPDSAVQAAERAASLLAPHYVGESSPGKRHVLWVVRDLAREEFTSWQGHIASVVGSDPAVKGFAARLAPAGLLAPERGSRSSQGFWRRTLTFRPTVLMIWCMLLARQFLSLKRQRRKR